MGPTAEDTRPDWSIQDIARIAGTTSRTLRHYHRIGLLQPSRVGSNGYRSLDENQKVEFDDTQGPKGPQAENIRPL